VIDIDAGLVERLLLELARDGAYGETGVWRTAYSPEWVAAQGRVAGLAAMKPVPSMSSASSPIARSSRIVAVPRASPVPLERTRATR